MPPCNFVPVTGMIMKILITYIFASFLFFSSSEGKDGDKSGNISKEVNTVFFTGTVKDRDTGEYLVGVEVEIEGANLKTHTDFDGNFSFENVSPGKYDISVNYISYQKEKLENFEISPLTEMLKFELHPLQ